MVTYFETKLDRLAIHRVGNKLHEEYFVLSDKLLSIEDELLNNLVMQYFLNPFEKLNEVFHFTHSTGDLNLNEVYSFCSKIFNDPAVFLECSQQAAQFLFHTANHPKIKGGELYVAYFKDLQLEGELLDAVGIFKSETKEAFLKIAVEQNQFNLAYEEAGINLNKLDKGCLVFNTNKEEGYIVMAVDHTNRSSDAVYWKDNYLQLKIRNDNFNKTNSALQVYKNFVTNKLDDEFELSKADKIDLLNKSMKYFKEKEVFDIDDFSQEVIGNPQAIDSFKSYTKAYEQEFDTPIADNFDISAPAVKKQSKVFKSILKLDKNFHIYIHGSKELIEKGFDEDRVMNYYKVYFKEEA
jgi:hypothetical protein